MCEILHNSTTVKIIKNVVKVNVFRNFCGGKCDLFVKLRRNARSLVQKYIYLADLLGSQYLSEILYNSIQGSN